MSAAHAIKKFRLRELENFSNHLMRYGALPARESNAAAQAANVRLPNPFVPQRNSTTGKWSAPRYSLRRQAELIKKAKASNTVHLLPPGPKLFRPNVLAAALASNHIIPAIPEKKSMKAGKTADTIWTEPVEWVGKLEVKEVAGADIGTRLYAAKKRMFKGHKWERIKAGRDKKKRVLMRDMAKRVSNYKAYYQRRKPNPLKPSRSAKAPKLPF